MLRPRRTAHNRHRVPHRSVLLQAVRHSSSALRWVFRLQKPKPAATHWLWQALAPPRIRNALPLTKPVASKKMRVAAKFAKKPSVLKKPAARLKRLNQKLQLQRPKLLLQRLLLLLPRSKLPHRLLRLQKLPPWQPHLLRQLLPKPHQARMPARPHRSALPAHPACASSPAVLASHHVRHASSVRAMRAPKANAAPMP
ncbi:MAG: hypothetical protein JWQ22_2993 [Devosia sp.]|nr:hypothetical protein [Devosia sp.]